MAGKKPPVPSSGSVQPSTGAPSQVDGMSEHVKSAWLEALRSGRFRQTTNSLRCRRGFCCLGVLREIVYPGCKGSLFNHDKILSRKGCKALGLSEEQMNKLVELNDVYERPFTEIADFIEANVPAVTVADVPGLSIADQTDVAVTSHQTEVE